MKPTQQLLGIGRPAARASKWRGPRETTAMRLRRLAREKKAHDRRKASFPGIDLPKLGRMP